MVTKQKYTNRAKATIWNKSLRMDTEGSMPGTAIMTFEMINTIEEKERALAQMQLHLEESKEQEAANVDVQTQQ
ncbi:hypothetical protein HY28_005081 [Salmonella enterica subsp. enterica]|nr:hypothetical protein [Salmonella enterica subsp. enterica serovar Panama]